MYFRTSAYWVRVLLLCRYEYIINKMLKIGFKIVNQNYLNAYLIIYLDYYKYYFITLYINIDKVSIHR